MKNKTYQMLAFIAVAVLALGVTVWAKTYTLQGTSIVPAATGTIAVKAANHGENTEVTLKVDNLASPSVLTPPANNYVVWIQSQGGQAENEGTLRVGENEKSELRMTTSATRFQVLVTAEADAHPQAPSNRIILRTEVEE